MSRSSARAPMARWRSRTSTSPGASARACGAGGRMPRAWRRRVARSYPTPLAALAQSARRRGAARRGPGRRHRRLRRGVDARRRRARASARRLTAAIPSSDAAPDHARHRRRLRRGQDHDHPRPRARARRATRSRTSAPTTTTATTAKQRAEREHHAAPSRLQPPRHPRPAPPPPAERRADHEAGLLAHRRHVRRARLLRCRAGSSSPRACSPSPRAELREMFDVRVYLDPPEELRRHWKVQRDCSRRGYTTDQVLVRARPARARLGGVHPAAAPPRRHRRLVPAGATAATRSTSTQADAARHAPASRPQRRDRRRASGLTLTERAR